MFVVITCTSAISQKHAVCGPFSSFHLVISSSWFNVYAVKPGTTDKLYLHTNPDMQLEIQWECPVGGVPEDCLEWEVEHNQEGSDGRMTLVCFFSNICIVLCSNKLSHSSVKRIRLP